MQGFSSQLKKRYKSKWLKNATGEGPRKVATLRKSRVLPKPDKRSRKSNRRRKRKKRSAGKKS